MAQNQKKKKKAKMRCFGIMGLNVYGNNRGPRNINPILASLTLDQQPASWSLSSQLSKYVSAQVDLFHEAGG